MEENDLSEKVEKLAEMIKKSKFFVMFEQTIFARTIFI